MISRLARLRWHLIATAPRDREILVFAPGAIYDLPDFVGKSRWHPDAGFCVCELREPTHWTEVEAVTPVAQPFPPIDP